MIRRPPRSPLFPYTPLSRSHDGHHRHEGSWNVHLRPSFPERPNRTGDPCGTPKASTTHRVFRQRGVRGRLPVADPPDVVRGQEDRKSTRLNSSHLVISYAVF